MSGYFRFLYFIFFINFVSAQFHADKLCGRVNNLYGLLLQSFFLLKICDAKMKGYFLYIRRRMVKNINYKKTIFLFFFDEKLIRKHV